MNRRQFAINTGASTLNLIIQFSVNFFLTAYLVRTVGSTAYGFFTLACTIVNYANIVSNALNSMASRFVGYEYFQKNFKGAIRYFSSVLYGDIAFVLIILAPALILIYNLDDCIDIPIELVHDVKILFLIVFLNLCISLIGSIFSAVYVITNRLDISSIRNVVSNILRALLLVFLYSQFKASIIYIGIATILTTLLIVGNDIYFSKRLLPDIKSKANCVSIGAIRTLTMSGIWNSVNQLGIIFLHGLDLLLCNQMISPVYMGYLSIACTMPNAVSSCISSFSYLFTPQFLEHFSKNEFELLRNDIVNSIKFMTVISCIPISFLIGFGLQFYSLWTPSADVTLVYILSVCIIIPNFTGGCINSVNFLYSVVNKVKTPALILLLTGVLNVAIVYLLLKFTDWGVICIVVVSAVLGLMRNIFFNAPFAAHCIKQPYHIFWRDIFKSFLCLVLGCIICYYIGSLLVIDSWTSLILIGGSASVLMAVGVALIILSKQQRYFLLSKIFNKNQCQ